MSDRELPDPESDAVLQFPRPRVPEPASPYRERVAARADPPPAESARRVVSRPEPPDWEAPSKRPIASSPSAPEAPIPAGFFDEIRRALRPFATFAGNHPLMLLLMLVGVACLFIAACGRSALGGSFAG